MPTLVLIRHGKASPDKVSYDELHPVGIEQAQRLGEYFSRCGQRFDAVYCGPLRRQLDTLRLMREAAGDAGRGWPAHVELPALAEAPVEQIMKSCLPELLQRDVFLQRRIAELGDGSDQAKVREVLESVFGHVIRLWTRGELARPGLESATEFGERVRGALSAIVAAQPGAEQIAVVTSNGVIGWVLSHVRGEGDADQVGPAHKFWNTSLTSVVAHGGRLRVAQANACPHLPEPWQRTFI